MVRLLRSLAIPLVTALVAASASARLWSAYLAVPNRHAFGWDASRRALLNIDAGEALARLRLGRLLVDLAGPETWPTLRMAFAAPLVALLGPSLEVESGLTIAHYAALFLVLGVVAARLASGPSALLVFATGSAALAANRALLAYAATGMLEVLSALATLAAVSAWIVSREPDSPRRVWPVALLGNLVFHTKWQHGLFFAAAVLLVEAASLSPDERRGAVRALRDVARTARRHAAAWLFLAAGVASAAVAAAVAVTGGGAFRVAGLDVAVRDVHGPFFWAAFALFYGLEVELWRARALLREAVPRRVRALWCWLATPMAVWLLMPFTWRLRTILVTSATYDSHAGPTDVAGRIAFYPLAMWREWYASPARVAVAAALALALVTAVRDRATRRRLVPLGALAGVELLALALASRANFQERFALNLAPLVALAAALPLAALRTLLRLAVAGALTAALVGGAVVPLWRRPALASALSAGFAAEEVATSCQPLVAALAYRDAALINETPAGFLHDCNLAVALDSRRRGARVDLAPAGRAAAREIVLLSACGDSPIVPPGFEPAAGAERRGQLCGVVLRRR